MRTKTATETVPSAVRRAIAIVEWAAHSEERRLALLARGGHDRLAELRDDLVRLAAPAHDDVREECEADLRETLARIDALGVLPDYLAQ